VKPALFGGSLISFGSAASEMGKMPGIHAFTVYMKYAWMIFIGYVISVAV
jgi:hypothetical protein